jgi:hypothetical protein
LPRKLVCVDERRRRIQHRLRPDDLRGADLRFSLLTLLHDSGRSCSIPELRDMLSRRGLVVGGPDPAKTIGDVMRLEVKKGRVHRVERGRYRSLPRPDTTTRRHRSRLIDLQRLAARVGDPGAPRP